ncbi:MAG: TonB-dependent receptor [Rikenellaceae bacterium]
MKIQKLFSCLLLFCLSLLAVDLYAQEARSVTGTVVDSDGIPVIGANILEKANQLNGTTTGLDGEFSLSLTGSDPTIMVSYVGYATQELVAGNAPLNITLSSDNTELDEVVVIGYGVQKKKLVTGATSQVSSDDLVSQSSAGLFNSMQSKVTGVTFSAASGMPGSTESITIRGLGTMGDSSPLYVIDGVAGADFGLISASDIESIDILKDAASAAIYGSRAANGVVLVTTKRGKAGSVNVTYDGYYAIQNVANKVEMCDAKEYMELQEEYYASIGSSINWSDYIPQYILDSVEDGSFTGTDWFDEMTNENAPMQSHSLTITGGTDMTRYSVGYTYFDQEGIFGAPVEPNLTRHNIRTNMDNVLIKNKDWDVLTLNTNIMYSHTQKTGISTGNRYNNDIQNAMVASPLMPVYNSEGEYYSTADKDAEGWLLDSYAYNPMALMDYEAQNLTKNSRLFGNVSVAYRPLKNLTFKTSLGYKNTTQFYRELVPEYDLGANTVNTSEEVTQTSYETFAYTWENTANYNFTMKNDHSFDIVLGQSIEKSGLGEYMSATNTNMIFPEEFDYAWLTNTSGVDSSVTSVTGYPYVDNMLSSVFGRVNYNYKEKYLFTAMMRADGSSKFAEGNRWGYFPSVSTGWVVTNEDFMQNSSSWLDFLKIRASWGQNGNCNIDNFQYLSNIEYSTDSYYYYGTDKSTTEQGAYSTSMANIDVTWETSEQLDLGFDAYFFNSRLSVVFDYYNKVTKDWLVEAPIPGSYGVSESYINGGDVRNRGVELGLTWRDNIGDLSYSVSVNSSYNKNVVLNIANDSGIIYGNSDILDQNTTYLYVAEEGMPIGYFYGYKTDGIFQNQEEIDSKPSMDGAEPGDLIYVDVNGDGEITEDDKTEIGNPFPDVTGGFNVSLAWRGWDFSVVGKFALGLQIAQAYRLETNKIFYNWTQEAYDNRWTGEGTSNTYPRIGGQANYLNVSDIYIHDADYLKIQNITLGFDVKKIWKNAPMQRLRLYASLQNYITITKYNGMDPEVGYGGTDGWSSGIDLGYYPSAKSTVFGANITF